MHQTAVSHWRKYGRERKFISDYASLQVTNSYRNRTAGTKQDIAKCPAVLRQREFGFGTAIQVVEYRPGNPALRQMAQILDVDDL
jgi:hypothetical protein